MSFRKRLTGAIDSFWSTLRRSLDLVTFCSIRIYGIENCTFREVRKGSYGNRKFTPLNLDGAKDLDALLSESNALLEAANDRRNVVTDKCKTLLTLSSLLLAIIGALLPKSFAFPATWMRGICFIAILCLLTSVLLLLVYFGIGNEQSLLLTQSEIELEPANLKKSLINDHLACEAATDNRTDYLADIYKVSRSYFLVAFFTIITLFAVNYFLPSNQDDAKQLVEQLRSNPDLIRLLQGPKGDKGDRGPKGDRGDRGLTGENHHLLSTTIPANTQTK